MFFLIILNKDRMTHGDLIRLRNTVGKNKSIPIKYESSILKALAYYPELTEVKIDFRLVNYHPVPYGTMPAVSSILKPPVKRRYIITLQEEANEPVNSVLFKNLPEEFRIAIIAHELVHVIQYHRRSVPELLKMLGSYSIPAFKKEIEREADMGAIDHGVGVELYKFYVFQGSVPGYLKKRPGLVRYYMQPDEIRKFIK